MPGTFPLTNGGARYLCSSLGSVGKIVKNIIRNYFKNICICDITYVPKEKHRETLLLVNFPPVLIKGNLLFDGSLSAGSRFPWGAPLPRGTPPEGVHLCQNIATCGRAVPFGLKLRPTL